MMKKLFLITFALLFSFVINGCEKKDNRAFKKVHWDRDMCQRCKMVVSDRKNTTEVRNPDNGKTYMFDDIGCAILWFHDNHIVWQDKAVIWITDAKTGKWIDARKAFYDTNNITPMAYGFCAHLNRSDINSSEEIVDFKEMKKRVIKIGK